LSRPDASAARAGSAAPHDERGAAFAEPWQAQAFALAVSLSAAGHFTWAEWAAALVAELERAERNGAPRDGSTYYEHWLATLERLVAEKGLAAEPELRERREAWAEAHRRAPHGHPAELARHGV